MLTWRLNYGGAVITSITVYMYNKINYDIPKMHDCSLTAKTAKNIGKMNM